ncbi:hypothetical protein FIBSPDRAFT_842766 [Athelia psychrophila]|uniref:Glycosyltransferase family 32 protein n=1 Tax=Athelia psychrophila TaxID=1759441 RepID=A0A167W6M3_9AGAM|nr:hypothetical protein FIBSPDRAFT_842766 [Fibularhizoctonia sp. CBS 109695]
MKQVQGSCAQSGFDSENEAKEASVPSLDLAKHSSSLPTEGRATTTITQAPAYDGYARDLPSGILVIPDEKLDLRPEREIIKTILTHRPVTSEKNIWVFWDRGWGAMRPWTQRNVIAWVRRFEPLGWTVRVLDMILGSINNVSCFLDMSVFPSAFQEMEMPQAMSDLVRLPLMYEFGGIWLDVGTMVFCNLDDIWDVLEDPSTPYTIGGYITNLRPKELHLLNTAVLFGRKGDAFLKRWQEAFMTLWEGRTSSKDIHKDPLVSWLGLYNETFDDYGKDQASQRAFTDYLGVHLVFERLMLLEDPSDGFSGREYWEKKTFKLDMLSDQAYAQEVTSYDGQRLYELFASQRQGLEPSERNQEAQALANYLVANTTTLKLFSGLAAHQVWLPAIWNRPENANADTKEGSFIAWLRYAQVHLQPTREIVPLPTEKIPDDYVVRAGACERKTLTLVRRVLK